METKITKKSSTTQLRALVEYMEENPEFARGVPIFGSSRQSLEDHWKKLVFKLNTMGPPSRTIAEWKKTWADLKSRTKKKIAENKKGLQGTGGGLYRFECLTELETAIDRTLFLSKSAAPSGKTFGYADEIDYCFEALDTTPSRPSKTVAVVTPTRQFSSPESHTQQQQINVKTCTITTQQYQPPAKRQKISPHFYTQTAKQQAQSAHTQQTQTQSAHTQQTQTQQQHQRKQTTSPRQHMEHQTVQKSPPFKCTSQHNFPSTSSAKKRSNVGQQIPLIRRQLRLVEQANAIAKEQADASKRMTDAAERMADCAEAQTKMLKSIEAILSTFLQNNSQNNSL
ncbi:uncharacterized protein LOC131803505 [Musca domestica]|uniref:Regulatory protein zeste n=1 Tax=Musca domestica TaxID=7370 RepID=A0ABM3V4X8_MUSDO|nr:uncharacterized protein LOC131803505 [Musca domestica]